MEFESDEEKNIISSMTSSDDEVEKTFKRIDPRHVSGDTGSKDSMHLILMKIYRCL